MDRASGRHFTMHRASLTVVCYASDDLSTRGESAGVPGHDGRADLACHRRSFGQEGTMSSTRSVSPTSADRDPRREDQSIRQLVGFRLDDADYAIAITKIRE